MLTITLVTEPLRIAPRGNITDVMVNNQRYSSSVTSRPSLTGPASVGVGLAAVSLAVLLVNALRITGVLPDLDVLRVLAPFGALCGALVLALLTWQLVNRTGSLGILAAGMAVTASVIGLVAIEFITNYVFPSLDPATRQQVLRGRTGLMLAVTSLGFLATSLAFSAILLWRRVFPLQVVLLFAIGCALLALRATLPVPLVAVGLVAMGVAALWMSLVRVTAPDGPGRDRSGG